MPAWYEVRMQQDDNETWLLTVPAFPELATFDRSKRRAFVKLAKGLYYAVGSCIDRKVDVPAPNENDGIGKTKIDVPPLLLLKLQLYRTMKMQNVAVASLAARLRTTPDRVERLLRVEHNSQIDLLADALHELGMGVSVEVRPIGPKA